MAWDEARARAAIQEIVDDAAHQLGDGVTWRWHPLDEAAAAEPEHRSLYLGAAGVLWALWYLARVGAARVELDWADRLARVHGAYRAQPDTGAVVPSYFLGEVGILLVRLLVGGDRASADRMAAAIRDNLANPTGEALWGAPGTMGAALRMHERTPERRWAELFADNVEQLWRTWQVGEHGHLWTQDLHGRLDRLLGAAHGFAGNVHPLLAGAALLGGDRREELYARCVETLSRTAIVDEDGVNWPPAVDARTQGAMLVQWCHGAPGIVTACAGLPRGRWPELERLLVGAGELVWRAGPLAKGFGLCHGTAGNGEAFLVLHQRTGDPAWLERARRFAMVALEQAEAMRDVHGRRRHTLWTGDPGLAVYLWQCITGEAGMPSLDLL